MVDRPNPFPSASADVPLVLRARRGDTEAFAGLVERYQRPLTATALATLRSVEDADDAVQETFLRAYSALGRLRDEERFGPWLFRILRNLIADRGRRGGKEVPGVEELGSQLPVEEPSPEQELLSRELETRVHRALEELPEGRQKEVFRLRFVAGLPIREIARQLGVHSGTVKVHLFRTSRRLRETLGEQEVLP